MNSVLKLKSIKVISSVDDYVYAVGLEMGKELPKYLEYLI